MRAIDVVVSFAFLAVAVPVAARAGDDAPTESVSFAFGNLAVIWTYEESSQPWRPDVGDVPTEITLYSGGVEVGNWLGQPASKYSLSTAFTEHEVEVTKEPYKGTIEISSWSYGPSTATFEDGRVVKFDALQVTSHVPVSSHELGHALGFRHEHTRPTAGHLVRDVLIGGAGEDLLIGGTTSY